MSGTTKIRAKINKNGICEVRALASHEMLSYQEAERAKKEANFITYLVAKIGDEITISWKDLKGNSDTTVEKIK